MKWLNIFVVVFLGLLFVSCTTTQPTQDNSQLEQERELLDEAVQEFFEEQEDKDRDLSTPKTGDPSIVVEQDITELEEIEEEEEPQEEVEVEEEPSSTRVDIRVLSVDPVGETTYDIDDEDDSVTFQVALRTEGLAEGENFVTEVLVRKNGKNIQSCQFIHIVGEDNDNRCEMDDFESYGDYDIEVYADVREKYLELETNLDNNLVRDEFELED